MPLKVDVPKSKHEEQESEHRDTFEWYMVRCGSKNGHQKDMCFKEIGLRAENILIILASIVNIIAKNCMTI